MARKSKVSKSNTINIKSVPVQAHIGASKFSNDDWKTIAFSFPRTDLALKFADKELRYNSLYFLFGYEDGHEVVYVGQALKRADGESVLSRLREHDKSTTEKYCDKWNWIVAVTNEDDTWGSTELDALESIFIEEIPEGYSLNGRSQNNAGADISLYDDKVTQIKALITSIGFKIFEDIPEKENIQVTSVVNDYSVVEDLQNGMARIPEIVTPDKVVKAMVDMLPAEVWNSHTVFLDPACKGGEYLREIYDRLMETEVVQSEFPNDIERSNHILKNQIFGIALSKVSLDRTAKKLLGEDRNLRIIPNYIDKLKGINLGSRPDGSQNNILDILNKEFGKEMKFDVVIGNPPYQDCNGGGGNLDGGKAIYQDFVNMAIRCSQRFICMITKNSWYRTRDTGGNKGFDIMKEQLLTKGMLLKIVDYPKYHEIFKGIGCSVSYFIADKDKHDREYEFISIIDGKVESKFKAESLTKDLIRGKELTSIATKSICNKNMSEYTVSKLAFGIDTTGVFDDSIIQTPEYNIKLISNNGDSYINRESITKNSQLIDYYKVVCTRAVSAWSGKAENVITSIQLLKPNEVCTGTYSVIFYSKDDISAINAEKYFKTKYVRELLRCSIDARGVISGVTFEYVPLQDFTSQSDIDWSQSISDIDKQLYKKYNLSDEEIAYIEKTIKPME